ncbi:unnamed protein product [Arabidopsis thaliana]|uniref:(thale cress) hypothetical protein n=1 Tax=Arabidopsis thaliana TaxID=3702 RepID=A0A7G2ET41_ARATH|nr:unnamed protein product [Arabidopsis thaliana]
MGYLSCKAGSAVAIAVSSAASTSGSTSSKASAPPESPIEDRPRLRRFLHRDLESATGGFDINNLLGRGSHGSVYKAVIGSRHIAVKRPSKSREISREFHNEFEILSRIRSPRFVNLLGFSADNSKEPLLVVEFMGNGSLYDVIHSDTVLNSGAISSWIDWAIPMIKRGKIGGIYDPRIGPPIDVSVRNHLGLVAAKCVRTCREKRPGMEEVVGWLTGLTKSVRSRRWDELSIGNPCMMVETEKDLIKKLPGQPSGISFRQYGGYVAVNEPATRFLYYYFVEAIKPSNSTPLVIWFNGGPGCSSVGLGAFQELGPFRVHSDGKTLFRNPYSWNNGT